MAMSVDGLISGMGTTDMINQLMQVEALPQTALKNKVAAQSKAVTAYQAINTKLAALTTAAKALSSTEAWGSVKSTSSSDAAIVTAKAGATTGSLTFTVDAVAAAHTMAYKGHPGVASVTAPAMTGSTIDVLRKDGSELTVPSGSSLQDVVNTINTTANAAYKAAAVQVAPGEFTLQLTAVDSGKESAFAKKLLLDPAYAPAGVDKLTGFGVITQGADAKLTVGDPNSGFEITSASNTFAELLPGLSVTVTKKQAEPVTIGVANDPTAIADKAKALVDAANAALAEIRTATATKSGTTAAGALAGDSALRALSQEILSAVATGTGAAAGSYSTAGVKLERGGTLSFNEKAFLDSYAADPAATQALFDSHVPKAHADAKPAVFEPGWDTATGLARKLETLGLKATEGIILPTDLDGTIREGSITGMITRRNESIRALNDQVSSWDTRLETRKASLQRQYAALEVALGKMQQQSSWLSGQLAGLA
jgi:flagellar hook-associated protein 2